MKITISLTDLLSNRFKTLMEESGEDNPRQIIKDAISAYEYLVLEERLGTEFFIRDKVTGKFVPNPFFENLREDEEDEEDEDEK